MRPLVETIFSMWRALHLAVRRFAKSEDGVTTLEWLAIAGVALIMGVTMTVLATSNLGATGSYIEGKVNSAASQ